ncbi:hypothetical protein [Streptosporangium sp. NPDC087985]|uniref:hypothetical protein n=1 Tax=Streptosporangium sp. NPDC087985 TaxID=3366196 RepID=UPI0038140E14
MTESEDGPNQPDVVAEVIDTATMTKEQALAFFKSCTPDEMDGMLCFLLGWTQEGVLAAIKNVEWLRTICQDGGR